ncbi:MAG TPA: zinc ribbon domain-containing protein, partial [Gaiellaceae bacterium]|nr:zinc ribbon domain-containing protein [Gaiellaceae bacterium]
ALGYRLEEIGIALERVNERGTSSTCPACGKRATKSGRTLCCQNPSFADATTETSRPRKT